VRVLVVGTGVMGLATARVLAERGHDVVALDRFGVGNRNASSSGATRIWRLAHSEPFMVRLARRTVDAWRELERRGGRTLLLQTGLLWRGRDAERVHDASHGQGVVAELVGRARQRELFPELVTDERPVLWQPEAGALLAAEGLAVQAALFAAAGGSLVVGERVLDIEARSGGGVSVVTATDAGGGSDTELARREADVVVVTAGPWAGELLARLGVELSLEPVLEQVAYVDGPVGWEQRPALIDEVTLRGDGGFYAMPTPGIGYKVGIEKPAGVWRPDDHDRTPSAALVQEARDLVAATLSGFGPDVTLAEVCTWTTGPDDLFVLDRVGDVVIGTSDGGQGFKFSPLIGEILADHAEGRTIDDDAAQLSLARFAPAP
jgi:sarcosine oxidase